jgi:hypothetical protein
MEEQRLETAAVRMTGQDVTPSHIARRSPITHHDGWLLAGLASLSRGSLSGNAKSKAGGRTLAIGVPGRGHPAAKRGTTSMVARRSLRVECVKELRIGGAHP